jgi:hypothetical protein
MTGADNLPSWPGAAKVYSRVMLINQTLASRSYAAARNKRAWRLCEEVCEIIRAMDSGCEETLKSWTIAHIEIWAPRQEESGQ